MEQNATTRVLTRDPNEMLKFEKGSFYNKETRLVIPEYGRNIHKLVEYCTGIADRAERTDCAYSIIHLMESMFPADGDIDKHHRMLWDHLALMSDFKLDIDWPFEVADREAFDSKPNNIPMPESNHKINRQYGDILIRMIEQAAGMPEGEERDALIMLLANQMKKSLLALNPDIADDERVFSDLYRITRGAINLKLSDKKLYEFKALPAPKKKKKK